MKALTRDISVVVLPLLTLAIACSDSTDPELPAVLRAAALTPLSSVQQSAQVKTPVASRPSVRVVDAKGRPVAGLTVSFTADAGGSPGLSTVLTDAAGEASVEWTLGERAGDNMLQVDVRGTSLPRLLFHATGVPGPASGLYTSGSVHLVALVSSGATLPSIFVRDAWGNGVENVTVNAEITSGDARIEKSSAISGALGVVDFGGVTLGATPGEDTLRIQIDGLDALTFTVRVNAPFAVTSIATGHRHSCAIALTGTAYCWGHNLYGQLGVGSADTFRVAPAPVSTDRRFVALSSMWQHTCAISNETPSQAYCWGSNESGQSGPGASIVMAPALVTGVDAGFVMVTTGTRHSCGLAPDGSAYCWGSNDGGRLGDGTENSSGTPVPVSGGLHFKTLAAGSRHTCGIATDDATYCWGLGESGQLGATTSQTCWDEDWEDYLDCSPVPLRVSGSRTFAAIAVGERTCALDSAGTVDCWGFLDVRTTLDVKLSAIAPTATCGITLDSRGVCWRFEGPALHVDAVGQDLSYAFIARGADHTCGILTTSAHAYCWGKNAVGQLGNNTVTDVLEPMPVSAPTTP